MDARKTVFHDSPPVNITSPAALHPMPRPSATLARRLLRRQLRPAEPAAVATGADHRCRPLCAARLSGPAPSRRTVKIQASVPSGTGDASQQPELGTSTGIATRASRSPISRADTLDFRRRGPRAGRSGRDRSPSRDPGRSIGWAIRMSGPRVSIGASSTSMRGGRTSSGHGPYWIALSAEDLRRLTAVVASTMSIQSGRLDRDVDDTFEAHGGKWRRQAGLHAHRDFRLRQLVSRLLLDVLETTRKSSSLVLDEEAVRRLAAAWNSSLPTSEQLPRTTEWTLGGWPTLRPRPDALHAILPGDHQHVSDSST